MAVLNRSSYCRLASVGCSALVRLRSSAGIGPVSSLLLRYFDFLASERLHQLRWHRRRSADSERGPGTSGLRGCPAPVVSRRSADSAPSCSDGKLERLPSSDGIGPVDTHCCPETDLAGAQRLPSSGGIGPARALSCRLILASIERLPRSRGRRPARLLAGKFSSMTPPSASNSTVPLIDGCLSFEPVRVVRRMQIRMLSRRAGPVPRRTAVQQVAVGAGIYPGICLPCKHAYRSWNSLCFACGVLDKERLVDVVFR